MNPHLFAPYWTGLVLLCTLVAPLPAEQIDLFDYEVEGDTVRIINYFPDTYLFWRKYDLKVSSVESISAIDHEGESIFIVALVDETLHIRIFGKDGERLADESEVTLATANWQDLGPLKELLRGNPIPNKSDLSQRTISEIIDRAVAIVEPKFNLIIPDEIDGKKVTTIGERAFRGRTIFASITIPDSVTSIGDSAFSGCSSLTSITIPNSITKIESSAFFGCSSLTGVTIPNSVTTIGRSAFHGCSSLTSVTIPNSVTTIESSAFHGCSSLTSITIPNSVTTIESSAFSGCSSLTSVTIPNNVTTIESSAFSGCSSLTNVTIPNSVTTIRNSAFYGCSSLTSVTIPNSVTTIRNSAFYGCISLISIVVASGNDIYASEDGVLFDSTKTMLIQCPGGRAGAYAIPNSVTTIESSAFSGCSSLTSVTIPNSVTTIESSAFSGCSSLTSVTIPNSVTTIESSAFHGCSNLTSITIPNNVTTIGYFAFSGCGSLTSVTIPDSVTTIGDGAFVGCSGLISIIVASGNPNYASEDGVLFDSTKTALIVIPESRSGAFTIPPDITTIGNYAFYGYSGLTSITIPSSVTIIGDYAFYGCSGLTSVTIPNSVVGIGDGAFSGCSSLPSVTIPSSVTTIGGGAFSHCSSLTSAIFLGDAPAIPLRSWLDAHVKFAFSGAALNFSVYYLSRSTGFTSGGWEGKGWEATYPVTEIDETVYPAASWLLENDLSYDTDLKDDDSLLLAYALDLDPHGDMPLILPEPAIDPATGTVRLTFHGASPGITYSVETSTDLQHWVTDGVMLSDIDPDNTMTASVSRNAPNQFMRLVVSAQ